ncbi:MAG: hypothetical protein KF892_10060 [Rhizobacter sp.]|nr:hypothetical protein [Rhizobacter sp.]
MTRIDRSGQLTELLRKRLSALKDASAASKTASAGRASAGTKQHSTGSSAAGSVDVAGALAKRIQLIATDDPDRHRKAFRAFLEAMLLAELGESLMNDAAFYQMVDQIQEQMEADPHLAEAVSNASAILLKGNL